MMEKSPTLKGESGDRLLIFCHVMRHQIIDSGNTAPPFRHQAQQYLVDAARLFGIQTIDNFSRQLLWGMHRSLEDDYMVVRPPSVSPSRM